jgi:ubiquitin-conjugating enzyme E2 Z
MSSISKETINRLIKDIKQIISYPLIEHGIYYIHDDTDMLKGYALIIGPEDTPYFAGNYFFEIQYPIDYPYSPPVINYCTNGNNIRFNPNLYKCGKVCISLLNTWRGEQWTSCQSISTVLLTLCTLLCKEPLLNEPGVVLAHKDRIAYNSIIEYSNINIAICDIVSGENNMKFFNLFSHHVNANFIKNYDKIMDFIENKKIFPLTILNTSLYNMSIKIDYTLLYHKITSLDKSKPNNSNAKENGK